MFGSAPAVVLVVLALVAATNYRNGTLGDWLRAKFLNAGAPPPAGSGGGTPPATGGPSPTSPGAQPAVLRPGSLAPPLATLPTPTGQFGETRPGHTHAGVDWPSAAGSPVFAAGPGRVTHAGAMGSYGLTVDVDHGGGYATRYAHLSRVGVRVGDTLDAADTLGAVGSTGRSTGNHLHFEVRRGGVAVDPLRYLGSTPIGRLA